MRLPRLRFGLRTLLVLFVLVAIPSAWLGKHWLRTRIERPIVAKIQAYGGKVAYDYQWVGKYFKVTNTPPGWKPLRAMLGDDFFATVKVVSYGHNLPIQFSNIEFDQLSELEQLYLYCKEVPESTIEKLGSLKKLELLSLGDPNIRPETLRKLTSCSALTHLTLYGEKVTTEHLRELKYFPNLTSFRWLNSPLTDEGLLAICELRNLESLDLLWPVLTPKFTAKGFQGLAQLKKLRTLELSGPADEAMAAIANLPAIDSVQLRDDELTDVGLLNISTHKNLHSLKSESNDLTDAGLKAFAGLTNLEWLRLFSKNFTDTGIANLAGLTKLKSLELESPGITDASLLILAQLSSLEKLKLADARITDQCLQQLSKLTKLKRLEITIGPNLTVQGVKQLRAALPLCKFYDHGIGTGVYESNDEIP